MLIHIFSFLDRVTWISRNSVVSDHHVSSYCGETVISIGTLKRLLLVRKWGDARRVPEGGRAAEFLDVAYSPAMPKPSTPAIGELTFISFYPIMDLSDLHGYSWSGQLGILLERSIP
jgi:hypothetical protein